MLTAYLAIHDHSNKNGVNKTTGQNFMDLSYPSSACILKWSHFIYPFSLAGGGEASLVDITTEDTKPPEEKEPPVPLLVDDVIATKGTKEEDATAPRGDIEDLEFWLSGADAPARSLAKQPPPAATGGSEPPTDKVPGEEEGEVKPKKKKEKVDLIIVCEYTQSVQRAPTVM